MPLQLRLTTLCVSVVLFSGCDAFEPDRLTELTGAKTEVERVYTCQAVYEAESIKTRVLRDSAKSEADRAMAVGWIAEAADVGGKFIARVDRYSSTEFKKASISFDKRFTKKEFFKLFNEYGSVLKAHCLELL